MSEQEKIEFAQKVTEGLQQGFENLLRRKAALDQEVVFANEHGQPIVIPAKVALENYLKKKTRNNP